MEVFLTVPYERVHPSTKLSDLPMPGNIFMSLKLISIFTSETDTYVEWYMLCVVGCMFCFLKSLFITELVLDTFTISHRFSYFSKPALGRKAVNIFHSRNERLARLLYYPLELQPLSGIYNKTAPLTNKNHFPLMLKRCCTSVSRGHSLIRAGFARSPQNSICFSLCSDWRIYVSHPIIILLGMESMFRE